MKKFLIVMVILLSIALIVAIGAFLYVSSKLKESSTVNVQTTSGESTQTQEVNYVEEGSIPLRDLPMSDSQKSIIETMGVDVDTYVITPEAIDCVREKLGADRVDEIVNGAAPSVWESAKIVPCL